MLTGGKVGLRARHEEDIPILRAELYDDVVNSSRAENGPWRLQIETLSGNTAMLRAAERNGFTREAVLRSSAWVMGTFQDEVILGLLTPDWRPPPNV